MIKNLQNIAILFFFILFFTNSPLHSLGTDLEEFAEDFVLEVKKIEIPGHPHAFNASLIRWQGSLLMSFREIPNYQLPLPFPLDSSSGNSQIGLVWLDDNFNIKSEPQMLSFNDQFLRPSRAEDARLVTMNETLYMVYSDNRDEIVTEGGFRIYFGEIRWDGENFSIHDIEGLYRFEGENKKRREKNWVPFNYLGNLLLAYCVVPHRILRPIIGRGQCETFSVTRSEINWDWGELRGGTPAFDMGDEYLAFFHSCMDMPTSHSEGKTMLHYFMGAYTFSKYPPFAITQFSARPIIGKNFYKGVMYEPYWKPVRVVFPCGYVYDEDFIWISYGRQDHEIWIAKLDKKKLFQSLIPTSSVSKKGSYQNTLLCDW